jgi:hypothetical protein
MCFLTLAKLFSIDFLKIDFYRVCKTHFFKKCHILVYPFFSKKHKKKPCTHILKRGFQFLSQTDSSESYKKIIGLILPSSGGFRFNKPKVSKSGGKE